MSLSGSPCLLSCSSNVHTQDIAVHAQTQAYKMDKKSQMVQSSTLLVLIEQQPVVPSVTYVLYARKATLVIWVITLQKFILLRLKDIYCCPRHKAARAHCLST